MTNPFRLLIVDDHPVVLFGLQLLFEGHGRFTVVAEARSARQARELMEAHKPDFVVSDLVMGERDGIDLIEDLTTIHPGAQILIYSSLDDSFHARAALTVGARGYLCKCESLESVAAALDRIAAGAVAVSPEIQAHLIKALADRDEAGSALAGFGLSGRERQVLERIGRAESLQAIAQHLNLSAKTVNTYRDRLKIKLGLDSLRALERFAEDARAGWGGV